MLAAPFDLLVVQFSKDLILSYLELFLGFSYLKLLKFVLAETLIKLVDEYFDLLYPVAALRLDGL